ncbi:MAG: type II and III secretion system protein family protein [Acetobacteraceae bacterium]|nr:type II and III secretion system protein family protein [Acetobacteraceae bacterium]
MRLLTWPCLALVLILSLASTSLQAQTKPVLNSLHPIHVDLEAGTGRLIETPGGTTDIFVADPKIADVRPSSPTSVFMLGVAPGHTSVAVLDKDGHPGANFDVTVLPSAFNAVGASSAIARALPGSHIHVEAAPKGLVLTGQVLTPGMAETAQGIAHSYLSDGQDVENRLTVASPQQVGLRVRIVEMSRTVSNSLGIDWNISSRLGRAFGQGFQLGLTTSPTASTLTFASSGAATTPLDGLINALATENLARVLAEPNLTAMSGETANFLAGGEFPIPVGESNNTISIEFKQYGVALAFTPTVISDRQIRLRVRPEVSELTQQGAVQIAAGNSTISVPALTVRRADTTIELGSGQSFAIAGLLQYNAQTAANFVPMMGDVPVLGELFRSDSFQRDETELVIIVTPYLVSPVDNPAALRTPGENSVLGGDIDRLIALRQGHSGPPAHRTAGSAGFVMP